MVVCICRDIRNSEYTDKETLVTRLMEDDVCCGKCLEEFVDEFINDDVETYKLGEMV